MVKEAPVNVAGHETEESPMFRRNEKHQTRRTADERRKERDEIFRRRFKLAAKSPRIWL